MLQWAKNILNKLTTPEYRNTCTLEHVHGNGYNYAVLRLPGFDASQKNDCLYPGQKRHYEVSKVL